MTDVFYMCCLAIYSKGGLTRAYLQLAFFFLLHEKKIFINCPYDDALTRSLKAAIYG